MLGSLSYLCEEDPLSSKLIIPAETSYEHLRSLCDRIGGILPTSPRDYPKAFTAFEAGVEDENACFFKRGAVKVLYGLSFDSTEGLWKDVYRQSKANFSEAFTFPSSPFDDYSCLYSWGREEADSVVCNSRFACGICFLPPKHVLKLRGLPKEMLRDGIFDLDYYVYGLKNKRPIFMYEQKTRQSMRILISSS